MAQNLDKIIRERLLRYRANSDTFSRFGQVGYPSVTFTVSHHNHNILRRNIVQTCTLNTSLDKLLNSRIITVHTGSELIIRTFKTGIYHLRSSISRIIVRTSRFGRFSMQQDKSETFRISFERLQRFHTLHRFLTIQIINPRFDFFFRETVSDQNKIKSNTLEIRY